MLLSLIRVYVVLKYSGGKSLFGAPVLRSLTFIYEVCEFCIPSCLRMGCILCLLGYCLTGTCGHRQSPAPLLLRDLMTQRSIERRLKDDGRPVTAHRRSVGSPAGVVYPLQVKAMALRGLLGGMRVVTVSVLECRSRVIARRVTRQDIQVRARAVE